MAQHLAREAVAVPSLQELIFEDQFLETLGPHVPAAYKIIYYIITVDGLTGQLKAVVQGNLTLHAIGRGHQMLSAAFTAVCCDSERS